MLSFIGRRLIVAALVATAVSAISFGLMFVSGDPAVVLAGQAGRAQDIEMIRQAYGLDRPIIMQYLSWVAKAVRGDFGTSLYFNLPVATIIAERLNTTLILGSVAFVVALTISIPLGILASLKPGGFVDRVAMMLAVLGQAIPSFWLGLILIVVFGVWWGLVPISGAETWKGYILPVAVLSYYAMPALMRLTRAGMIDTLSTDFVRTARAKGLPQVQILLIHTLRNAILPLVSLAAVQLGIMLSGSIVIESVFALNGLGRLAWESLLRSDLPVVQAIILILSLIYVILTMVGDLVNAWLDPRLRSAR